MTAVQPDERREFQRLNVDPPIPATLGTDPVSILEIGVLGARVQHSTSIDGTHAELHFSYNGGEVDMKCEVVRTLPRKSPYPDAGFESGLRFLAAMADSGDRLREMLGDLVAAEINARRAHGSAMLQAPSVDGDKTVRSKDAGFISFRFENGKWIKRPVFLPEQPKSGFTVSQSSDATELQRLCAVYEASDEEGRRLIRLFAELSVSDVLQIPPPL